MGVEQGKLGYIDALRGIAILMVVLVHTAQNVKDLDWALQAVAIYGQLGVQLFFVASAYTLCLAAVNRQGEPGALGAFYLRRFFRIAPLYYVAIALYGALHAALPWVSAATLMTRDGYTPFNIAANMVFVHGLVPSANKTIVPGGWSIGTEMLFYAVFPLLFAWSKRFAISRTRLALMVSGGLALNLVLQWCFAGPTGVMENNSFAYFSLLNQLPVFLVGIAAFWSHRLDTERPGWQQPALHWLGFALLTAATLLLWKSRWPLAFALIPSVAGLSFVCLLNAVRAWGSHPAWLRAVGRVSYSMYVFHFLFAWLALYLVVPHVPASVPPAVTLVVGYLVVVALTFLVARVTEQLLERPGIALGSVLVKRWKAAAASGFPVDAPATRP
ncbi:MAG: acyltransferase [Comamonadaceae bacterium]|nr:MAG: acyltransferase [Comamonadaceae bacterium]